MADTPGEQVAAAVDGAVQQAEQNAQDEIAAAKARADAANAEAARIADAAIATDLGRQIAGQRQEFETWRQGTETRLAELAETNRQQAEKLTEATGLFTSIRQILTPPPEARPPASAAAPGTAPTDASSGRTEPNGPREAVPAETPAPAPPRKRHFL